MSPVPVAESNIQLLQRLQPQQSEPTASKQTIQVAQSNNGGGPSGNPIMDLLSGHVRRGKHEFDQPINMDELKEDFDFCGNLALFQKVRTLTNCIFDDVNIESVVTPSFKCHKNFTL